MDSDPEEYEELPLGLWGGGFSQFEINQAPNVSQEETECVGRPTDSIDDLVDSYYPEETEECVGLWTYPVPSEQKNLTNHELSSETLPSFPEVADASQDDDDYDEDSLPLWLGPTFDIEVPEDKPGYKEISTDKVPTEYEEQDFTGTKKYFERIQTTSHK
ncbi:hypothetical protein K493DRAFT_318029 [Basidiobolus meristosporus CBS 931.73]|uniref:Uncharacterized protein n=1 Tax=Basidiobolus meristosporus CBS 931.73 TaxID=1314790 RepID=A0A1Y1XXA1_9FUNG|nr:hypothetical protein K493DRAFT_318029 [Basidiobolus meristosporus CBS 931.73]|eukprot:ORX90370.1 hypothetical protein K493DRAFT_318029 [Basidiobolus meristosporus CBS 931.73]